MWSDMIEKTLIIIKPDAVQRGLTGKIIKRFEDRGFKIVASKFLILESDMMRKHYAEHEGKRFFNSVCEYMSSSPVMVMVWEGVDIIKMARNMIGPTDAIAAPAGTIRGDFGLTRSYNLVHGSDSVEAAKREIDLYFSKEELVNYELITKPWLVGND
jgi:nucleoside-diphosphate kinase